MVHKLKRAHRVWVFALLVCLLLSLSTPAYGVSVSDFTDVSQSAWYYDPVSYVTSRGLFNGTSATTFTPNGTMTRGMFITVLGRYAGVDADAWCAGTITGDGVNLRSGAGTTYSVIATLSKNTAVTLTGQSGNWYRVKYGSSTGYIAKDYVTPRYHGFSDVDYGSYYAGYVIWGYEAGVVDGTSSTTFSPNAKVTREQICKLLTGYASYAGITLKDNGSNITFTDQSSISSWATAGVSAMQKAGVVVGEPDGSGYRFRPKSSATRAEAATIFQRFSEAGTGGSPSDQSVAPASFLGESISIRARTVRAGILCNTRNFSYAVSSVTLQNLGGSGFEYGTFSSDRSFSKSGDLSPSTVVVTTSGSTFTVKDSSGNILLSIGGNLAIRPVGAAGVLTRVNGEYRYRGAFELRQAYNASGKISVINYVDIEDYVKGVIPYEFGNTWPAETLKAAAICARNYVMSSDWSAYSSYGFDIMANASSQTYRGRAITYSESYFSATDAAVDATSGVYLTYNSGGTNRLCSTFYFSSDGGATEDYAHIWGGSGYSYLIGKVDPYEASAASQASNYTHSITNSRTGTAMKNLASRAGLGNTTIAANGIRIETYPVTGNVKSITLTGDNGKTATIDSSSSFDRWDFLSAFGFTAYSYRYSVAYDSSADTFTCTRLGWGHNIGLSQWGAYAMAKYYDMSYQSILGFYYDGTHLQYGVY